MTVQEACGIRDRAITLGLENCCEQCREALVTLAKLGQSNGWTMIPPTNDPTYPQGARIPTLGIGTEQAARYLRRQIRLKEATA